MTVFPNDVLTSEKRQQQRSEEINMEITRCQSYFVEAAKYVFNPISVDSLLQMRKRKRGKRKPLVVFCRIPFSNRKLTNGSIWQGEKAYGPTNCFYRG